MKHGVKKIKFNWGKDANKMLMRKLAINFLSNGHLQTTLTKAKALKPYLEKLVSKMKLKSEANKNYLLRYLGEEKIINNGFKVVGPALSKINGGYVRIVKMNMRSTDGATMARIIWVYPVVSEEIKNEKLNRTNKTS